MVCTSLAPSAKSKVPLPLPLAAITKRPSPLSRTVSFPRPPSMVSRPKPPVRTSSAVEPLRESLPAPPSRVTPRSKPEASMVFADTPPVSVAVSIPVKLSISVPMVKVPVPAEPAKVMFASRLTTKVSVPPPAVMVSLPRPPVKLSPWLVPIRVSAPSPPVKLTPPRVNPPAFRVYPVVPVILKSADSMPTKLSLSVPITNAVSLRTMLDARAATKVSVPAPPSKLSLPKPPCRRSFPLPPLSVLALPSPMRVSP